MSQPLIAARNAPVRVNRVRPEVASPERPALRVVTPPAALRLRVPLPLACVVLLTLGLFGLLMTNIAIAGDAYQVTDRQVTSQALADQQQAADEALASLAAPQNLAAAATALDMVPAPGAVHLTAHGAVGQADAAVAPAPTPSASAPSAPASAAATPAPQGEVEAPAAAADAPVTDAPATAGNAAAPTAD